MVHADPSVSSDSISLSCRNLIQRTATVAPSAQHCAISVFIHTFRTGVHCISTPFADLQHIFRFSVILPFKLFQSLLPCHRALIVPSRTRGRTQVAAPSSESSPLCPFARDSHKYSPATVARAEPPAITGTSYAP